LRLNNHETLFGLAPGGVYPAITVTSNPVRSYRTLSALPVLLAKPSAVFSLLHLSSACAAQALPGTLLIGARTFLPSICLSYAEAKDTTIKQRLSGQLDAHSTCSQCLGQVEAQLLV